ncbi:hypothetical protein EC988_000109 [Linderina pennispora]|nr:hypothetical protein EC988_000109 [Linderina pennispora]
MAPSDVGKRMSNTELAHVAELMGMRFDPIGPLDKVTIICGGVFYGVTLLLLIYAIINRNYAPIRAKNVRLTILVYIGGSMWFVGDIATNGHIEMIGAWSKCKIWCLWFRVFFAYTFSAAFAIRNYALYRVFVQHRPYRGLGFYTPIIGMFATLIAFCLTTQFISDEKTVKYVPEYEMCTYVWGFRGACLGLLWLIWFVVLYFVLRIRNIHSSFNERIESIIICFLAFSTVLFTTLLHTIQPEYPLNAKLRVANTWYDFCMGNISMWVMLAYPCFNCMFNKEKFLQHWTRKLHADGLRKEYRVETTENKSSLPLYSALSEDHKGGGGYQETARYWREMQFSNPQSTAVEDFEYQNQVAESMHFTPQRQVL